MLWSCSERLAVVSLSGFETIWVQYKLLVSLLLPLAVIQELGLNIDEHTTVTQLINVPPLSPAQRKTSP